MSNPFTGGVAEATTPTPSRQLIAAGIKRGSGPLLVEQAATAPLPPAAVYAMHRLELALADRTVANFDNHGSFWGFDTVEKTEADIDEARAAGTAIDEWETVDRDGQLLHVVRLADPRFLDTICVFSSWPQTAKAAA